MLTFVARNHTRGLVNANGYQRLTATRKFWILSLVMRQTIFVTQMGVAPNDPVPKTKMFVLVQWKVVDFNAYACKGNPRRWTNSFSLPWPR